jgi:hypothetical protein
MIQLEGKFCIKMDLGEIGLRVWTGYSGWRWGLVVGFCEHSNEPFGSINGKEISRLVKHTISFPRRSLVKGQHLFPFLLNFFWFIILVLCVENPAWLLYIFTVCKYYKQESTGFDSLLLIGLCWLPKIGTNDSLIILQENSLNFLFYWMNFKPDPLVLFMCSCVHHQHHYTDKVPKEMYVSCLLPFRILQAVSG